MTAYTVKYYNIRTFNYMHRVTFCLYVAFYSYLIILNVSDMHSRVCLQGTKDDDFLSTYINANYLKVSAG